MSTVKTWTHLFIAAMTFGTLSQAIALPAQKWACVGTDLTSETPVQFNLVFSDHDGQDFTYKSLEQFYYAGVKTANIDLTKKSVPCSPTEDGNLHSGVQSWTFNQGIFTFTSGCENETVGFKATCH